MKFKIRDAKTTEPTEKPVEVWLEEHPSGNLWLIYDSPTEGPRPLLTVSASSGTLNRCGGNTAKCGFKFDDMCGRIELSE